MDEYEKNMRCRNARMLLKRNPADDACIVYGRNVGECEDCAFRPEWCSPIGLSRFK